MATETPTALGPSFTSRRAAKSLWDERHPVDPTAGLVCIYDDDVPVEDRRTKEVIGVQRVRRYAHRKNLTRTVAERTDDGPLVWWQQPPAAPRPKPRTAAIIRRYHGNRPSTNR